MDLAFIKVLNMSISASWLVLAVLGLRFLLKKSPRWIHVALWGLVALRLICPISIESAMSLIPSAQTVPEEVLYMEANRQYENVSLEILEPRPNTDPVYVELDQTVSNVQTWDMKWSLLWPAGMALMAIHAMVSYLKLRKKVSASLALGNGVYLCDYIDTPFILGILHPRIYLPSEMAPDSASHVLAHERAHIARRDHWWKPLGYLLLTVHWFNPLLWLAYILLCRDIELACDERVVRQMALPQRKAYSDALLRCSVSRRYIAACPLAFGEVGVKERVKTVLHYKKPAFWIVLIAILALMVTAVCFLTDPVTKLDKTYRVEEVVYRNPVLSYYMTEENAPMFQITGDNNLRIKELDEEWVDLGEFTEIQLSELNFDALFWGFELGQPWEEAYEAWILALPPDETANSTEFYLLLRQAGGLYLGEGIAFTNVYPLHEHILDATLSVNWLYRLREVDPEQDTTEPTLESPYGWSSTLRTEDVDHTPAILGDGDWASDPVEGANLAELVALLNQVEEDQFVMKKPEGEDDPLWNDNGTHLWISSGQDTHMLLRYVEDTLLISSTDYFGIQNSDYWTIENQELKDWMKNLSYGGSYMLSESNREEIRQLLRMDYVEFFSPQEYDDLLFVGCKWDHDRGLGVAVFKKVAYGYKLLHLIRDEEVKPCAVASKLYYCDYNNLRIFLILNQSVTGMDWDGAYETSYTFDSRPALVVEYFPWDLGSMYRFRFGNDGATTMYIDWQNETHAQVPDYTTNLFANPDDAHSICAQVQPEQVDYVSATEILEVDDRFNQACVYRLKGGEMEALTKLLNSLPETAFEPAAYPENIIQMVDIAFRNYTGMKSVTPFVTLGLQDGVVYFRFSYSGMPPFRTWKIGDSRLAEYLESFFAGDTSNWEKFSPYPKSEESVSFETHGVKITIPKLLCFEYELTEQGIRFKPEEEESWVELQYLVEPFAVCGTGLKTSDVIYGGHFGTKGVYDNNEYWSFMDLKPTLGDVAYNIVLLNEDTWVEEYDREMYFLLNLITFEVIV